jgi:phosphate transport system protein
MNRFRNVLEEISTKISLQAEQVELMVQHGLEALETKSDRALEKIRKLERLVNELEVEIESDCVKTLALYHPKASDLRFVSAILKANGALDRFADLARNLAERAEALGSSDTQIPSELADMTRYALKMVQDADKALKKKNVALARSVCQRDDQLDAMNRELIGKIADVMENDGNQVRSQLHIFSASRIIERIGDHATNIAEDVLFLVEGDIQRHQFKFPGSIDRTFIPADQT